MILLVWMSVFSCFLCYVSSHVACVLLETYDLVFSLMVVHDFTCVNVCCFLLPLLGFFSCRVCVVGNLWFGIFTYAGSWFYLRESLHFLLPVLCFFSYRACVVGNLWFGIFTYAGSWFYLCESLLFLASFARFLLMSCVCFWKLKIWCFYLWWFKILFVWKSGVFCFLCYVSSHVVCVCCWKLMIWYFYLCWFMILLVWKSVVSCFLFC